MPMKIHAATLVRTIVFALSGMVFAASAGAAADAAKTEQDSEAVLAEAMAVIHDDRFAKTWGEGAQAITPENADKVIHEAEAERGRKRAAFDRAAKACVSRFFVNRCIDQAKSAQFEADRALRSIVERAQDVERAERTREIEERRRRAAEEPKRAPMEMREPHLKEPAEPMDLAPKTVREPSKPMSVREKSVREPSKPIDQRPAEAKSVDEAERAELEEANLKAYEERQRRAAERMARAEEIAQKRRAEREENRRHFEESLKQREEAQQRYETQRKEGGNGRQSLSEFF